MNAILLIVTGLSLLVAGFMSAIAWRVSRDERQRSDVRVAELSSAIYGDDERDSTPATLFKAPGPVSSPRYAFAAAAGACLVSILAGVALVAARGQHRTASTEQTPSQARTVGAPLELLALEHERVGEELVVRGIVRNPSGAAERDGLGAVVLLFGRDGSLLSSGRSSIPAVRLAAGATTPFVVTVPEAGDVDRFRLSFRTDARVEPHVDRRTRADADKELAP